MSRPPNLYLVKRGPKPEWSKAPHHPVILCDNRETARWEAGWTGDRAWIWEASSEREPYGIGGGLLLVRWEGLDIDYGHVVRGGALPDGTGMGFHHPSSRPETWALLRGAVWWSERPLPASLRDTYGVIEAPDDFTRDVIQRDVAERRFNRAIRRRA